MSALVNVRASSLGELTDCGHRWYVHHVLGKRPPSSGKATLGTAIHRGTAKWDSAVIAGNVPDVEAATETARAAVRDPGFAVVWDDDEKPEQVAQIAADLTALYIQQIAPQFDFVAVEVRCDGVAIHELGISLSGSVDRVYRAGNGHGIADVKSGGNAVAADGTVKTSGFAYQLGTYELLASAGSGLEISEPALILGLQTGKTARGQRAAISQPVVGARELLVGDGEQPGVLELIAGTIRSGTFVGNPKSMMCHKRYCGAYDTCRFRL